MEKFSLNLIRAGRAALAFLAIYSTFILLSDIFLYIDGYHTLDVGLFVMRLFVAGLSWGIIYDRKTKFREIKDNPNEKNTKKAMTLFTQYIISFFVFGIPFFFLYSMITGVYEHNVIDESHTSINSNNDDTKDALVYVDGFLSPTSLSKIGADENSSFKEIPGFDLVVYSSQKKLLLVTKSGLNYLYCQVPSSLWSNFSNKTFYHQNLENNYICRKSSALFPCEEKAEEDAKQLFTKSGFFVNKKGVIVRKDGSMVSQNEIDNFDTLAREEQRTCIQSYFPDLI